MNTRINIDLKDENLFRLLKLESYKRGCSMQMIVVRALNSYFQSRQQNLEIMKLAEETFSEWNNSKDKEYDRL